ncbi:type III-B CRISPR module RAMP protein Cmr4 [Woodsholea maritima]|uniref:type III-B CRISPR module RAMP protein Cmr4 n=1 Tax=Woodsholea maritima TaxID=240237 RepID=UPI00036677A1|nr:type III-B CRISPR module RAMP protein Cmr4 [Woodsholea maritima]
MPEFKSTLIGMLAETELHPGVGQSASVIDLPVAREASGMPFIPGSSIKGAFRAQWPTSKNSPDFKAVFGEKNKAGQILFSDARLILLPLRSLTRPYYWATSPFLLNRFKRDLNRFNLGEAAKTESLIIPLITPGSTQMAEQENDNPGDNTVYLEEFSFKIERVKLSAWIQALKMLLPENEHCQIVEKLLILSDEDFTHFARQGLPVRARNELHEETKVSKNLWYEETLPTDTVLYSGLQSRTSEPVDWPSGFNYLQVGGDETVGQGWVQLTLLANEQAEEVAQ